MSGPTGLEPGGARTLIKPVTYINDGVPPAEYPTPANVFSGVRASVGYEPSGPIFEFKTYTFTNPVTNSPYTVVQPLWGGPAFVWGKPP